MDPKRHLQRYKIPLLVSFSLLLIGIAVCAFALTPYMNPPQCGEPGAGSDCIIGANIGAGLVLFAGIGLASIGVLYLLAIVAYAVTIHVSGKKKVSLAISVTLPLIAVVAAWVVFYQIPTNRADQSRADIAGRRSLFVAYTGTPDTISTTVESPSATLSSQSTDSKTLLNLDLYGCVPGLSEVSTPKGKVPVLFSGVAKSDYAFDELASKFSDCVFYLPATPRVGQEVQPTPFTQKCKVGIDPQKARSQQLVEVEANSLKMVGSGGICEELTN